MTRRPDNPTNRASLPRQARAWATRARLVAAGRDAFAIRGHDQVNLTEHILKPASVSVGSFYSQFADKTDLLIAVLDEAAEQRFLVVFPDGDPTDREPVDDVIAAAFERFFESLDTEDHLWRIQLRERANPDPRIRARVLAGNARWTEQVTLLLQRSDFDDDEWTERAAELLVTFSIGVAASYLDLPAKDRRRARPGLLADATRFALSGLGSVPGPGAHTAASRSTRGKRSASK